MFYARGPAAWETNDGTIPYRLFLLLLNGLTTMEYGEELRLSRGTALGAAIAVNGTNVEVGAAIRSLAGEAFPETYDGVPETRGAQHPFLEALDP